MGGHMSTNRTRAIVAAATVTLLVACGNNSLLPVTSLFGPTMTSAFAKSSTDAPLTSAQILQLASDRPVSLTTDPIDL